MSKKILVVDDDEILCEFFSVAFKLAGYDVSIAHNGEAAIEFLTKNVVDIITLDHDMPGISGIETLKMIKEKHLSNNTKIIIMSANVNMENNKTYQQFADHILIKPVGYHQLTALVQQLTAQTD